MWPFRMMDGPTVSGAASRLKRLSEGQHGQVTVGFGEPACLGEKKEDVSLRAQSLEARAPMSRGNSRIVVPEAVNTSSNAMFYIE